MNQLFKELKQFKLIILAVLLSFVFGSNALATNINTVIEVEQGQAFTVELPAEDFTSITGNFDGHEIKFFKIQRLPDPEEPITRAEFLEMMFLNNDFGEVGVPRVAHAEDPNPFPDVDMANPYYEYILKAKQLGIVSGYEDGNFYPYNLITRGQAAKMLVEAFKPAPTEVQTALFADVSTDHRFFNYINDAVAVEWFKGYPDGLMRPDRNINFLEAEIVVKRAAIPENFTPLKEKPYFKAYTAPHRTVAPGIKTLNVEMESKNYGKNTESKQINVLKRAVRTVRFSLDKEDTDLFGDDAQTKTWNAVYSAIANPTSTQLWEDSFIIPTKGEITLGFGDVLYINGAYSGSHFGIDYANQSGTEIRAANSGRVTLAEYTPAFGNTVVIDHGMNIFTMYLHMSELKVSKYDMVKKEDVIGLMGSTGISSGSHLHYTQFVGDVIVDSDQWIADKL